MDIPKVAISGLRGGGQSLRSALDFRPINFQTTAVSETTVFVTPKEFQLIFVNFINIKQIFAAIARISARCAVPRNVFIWKSPVPRLEVAASLSKLKQCGIKQPIRSFLKTSERLNCVITEGVRIEL